MLTDVYKVCVTCYHHISCSDGGAHVIGHFHLRNEISWKLVVIAVVVTVIIIVVIVVVVVVVLLLLVVVVVIVVTVVVFVVIDGINHCFFNVHKLLLKVRY